MAEKKAGGVVSNTCWCVMGVDTFEALLGSECRVCGRIVGGEPWRERRDDADVRDGDADGDADGG